MSVPSQNARAEFVYAHCVNSTHIFRRLRIIFLIDIEVSAIDIEWCLSIKAAMSIEMAIEPGDLLRSITERLIRDVSLAFSYLL